MRALQTSLITSGIRQTVSVLEPFLLYARLP